MISSLISNFFSKLELWVSSFNSASDAPLRRIYHEAPDDIMELIVSRCSDVDGYGYGRGGMNDLRLADKRLKRMVSQSHVLPCL